MESTYIEAQESYMDTIHLPDSYQAKDNWEKTLYTPLREFLNRCIARRTTSNSFLYLGCGPKAPLLASPDSKNMNYIFYILYN